MAITKWLARDLTVEVDTSGTSTPSWTAIGGLESVTHKPSTDRADTTDFDSGGRPEHIVAQRGDEWTLSGMAREDASTGDRDPGQIAIETLGRAVGADAMGHFRITSPGGNTIEFDASPEVVLPGGGHNDAASWAATLTVSGDITYG